MNAKNILTAGLLTFVAISLAVVVADFAGWRTPNASDAAAQTSESTDLLTANQTDAEWTAYFFHASHRCPSCRKIESYGHEALLPDIEQGRVAWQTADYTAPANQSLVERFEVFSSTIVLVHRQDGKVTRWKNLEGVWDHTHDRAAFLAFTRGALRDFREE